MKNLAFFFILLVSQVCWSQTAQPEIVRTVHLTINQMPPYLFFLEVIPFQVRGELNLFSQHLEYRPKNCFPDGLDKLAKIELFPCHNDLVKDINIQYDSISKIRRGYRAAILVPNMVVIKQNNGNKYRFMLWGRGKVVRFIKARGRLLQQPELIR